MKKISILLSFSLFLSSCSVVKEGTSKSVDVIGSVLHIPIVADLEVQQTKEEMTKVFVIRKSYNLELAKNETVRELLKKAQADVLVEPSFESTTSNGKIILTVKGWPARYQGFRNIEKRDIELLDISPAYLQKVTNIVSGVQAKKK